MRVVQLDRKIMDCNVQENKRINKLQKTREVSARKQKVQGQHCKFGELDSCTDNIISHLPQTIVVVHQTFTNTHTYISNCRLTLNPQFLFQTKY